MREFRNTPRLLLFIFPKNQVLVVELAVSRKNTALKLPAEGFNSIPSFQLPPKGVMLKAAPVLAAKVLLIPYISGWCYIHSFVVACVIVYIAHSSIIIGLKT